MRVIRARDARKHPQSVVNEGTQVRDQEKTLRGSKDSKGALFAKGPREMTSLGVTAVRYSRCNFGVNYEQWSRVPLTERNRREQFYFLPSRENKPQ